MDKDKLDLFKKEIEDSKKIVFFSGAGVSTASGIPDFRSSKGVYKKARKYHASGEEILSVPFFEKNPKEFFDFSFNEVYFPNAKPSTTHNFISDLEHIYKKDVSVVTQNIDGLHQKAGSTKVYEIHGSQNTATCSNCKTKYKGEEILDLRDSDGIPRCKVCNGIVRHDVVLFGQALPQDQVFKSIRAIEEADMLVILGTSLVVYPAAGLINYFNGKYIVVVNKEDLHIRINANIINFIDDMNEVFKDLKKIMKD